MKMTKNRFSICEICRGRIWKYDERLLRVIEKICSVTAMGYISVYDEKDCTDVMPSIVEKLEKAGFVITCDLDDHMVGASPNKKIWEFDQEEQQYCFCRSDWQL
jgi:hypothetical protein